MKKIILFSLFLSVQGVNSWTDFQCLNDCTAKGYSYGYCKKECSY